MSRNCAKDTTLPGRRNFAHFVKREVVEVDYRKPDSAWFAEHQPEDQGLDAPRYHVTRAKVGPVTRVAKGDTVWLFSQLRSPWGALPPALDAKIIVAEISNKNELRGGGVGFRFTAGPGSVWFPLYDCTEILAALMTTDANGQLGKLLARPDQAVGRALRSMRELSDSTPLIALEAKFTQLGFDFVSYRLLDGTPAAFRAVWSLLGAGRPIWWDRWSLPRRLAERREFLADPALDKFIRGRIAASDAVFGIGSPAYGDTGSYSRREMDTALGLGKFKLLQPT